MTRVTMTQGQHGESEARGSEARGWVVWVRRAGARRWARDTGGPYATIVGAAVRAGYLAATLER